MKTFSLLIMILATAACQKTNEPVQEQREVRYDPEFEKKCFNEIESLKCGSPDGKNTETFLKCVDAKIAMLSPGCQEMHKAYSKEEHSGHGH